MVYKVFTENHSNETRLDLPPVYIWVLSTLEICVAEGRANRIILSYPSYPLDNQASAPSHDESYWAPPFVAYPVLFDFSAPASLGSLRRLAEQRLATVDVPRDLGHLAYQMGLSDVDFEKRESFIELKTSPRSPALVRAYYILRHGLAELDSDCLRNLADPEVRRGYVFCPVDLDNSPAISTRFDSAHSRNETWFLGKPMQSNIEHVLRTDGMRSQVERRPIPVPGEQFYRRESGIIFVADISHYGRAMQYVRANMRSFDSTGDEFAEMLSTNLIALFYAMLGRLGVTQVQFAGDGFVAALPSRLFFDDDETAACANILDAWSALIAKIERQNLGIRDESHHIGSRLAIHYGQYRFGRLGGVDSFSPAFDGYSIVEAVRVEQGLRDFLMSDGTEDLHDLSSHHMAVASSLDHLLETGVGSDGSRFPAGWEQLRRTRLTVKEYDSDVTIFSYLYHAGA